MSKLPELIEYRESMDLFKEPWDYETNFAIEKDTEERAKIMAKFINEHEGLVTVLKMARDGTWNPFFYRACTRLLVRLNLIFMIGSRGFLTPDGIYLLETGYID